MAYYKNNNNQRRNTPQSPANQPAQNVQVLYTEYADKYVQQMINSVTGPKPTKADLFAIRIHIQANHNEVFKSLVLMPIDSTTGKTLTDKYGKDMGAWCVNKALRTLAFGITHYSVEEE